MLKSANAKLGFRLRTAIYSAKVPISVKVVADACGVSTAAVYGWFRTGAVAKHHLPVISRLTGVPITSLLGDGDLVRVDVARGTEVSEVELPRDAIELARAWMVLPENERNEFRRQIDAAAARYRDRPPATLINRKPTKKAGKWTQ